MVNSDLGVNIYRPAQASYSLIVYKNKSSIHSDVLGSYIQYMNFGLRHLVYLKYLVINKKKDWISRQLRDVIPLVVENGLEIIPFQIQLFKLSYLCYYASSPLQRSVFTLINFALIQYICWRATTWSCSDFLRFSSGVFHLVYCKISVHTANDFLCVLQKMDSWYWR